MNNNKIPYIDIKGFKCSNCGCEEYECLDSSDIKEYTICINCGKTLDKNDYKSFEIKLGEYRD